MEEYLLEVLEAVKDKTEVLTVEKLIQYIEKAKEAQNEKEEMEFLVRNGYIDELDNF